MDAFTSGRSSLRRRDDREEREESSRRRLHLRVPPRCRVAARANMRRLRRILSRFIGGEKMLCGQIISCRSSCAPMYKRRSKMRYPSLYQRYCCLFILELERVIYRYIIYIFDKAAIIINRYFKSPPRRENKLSAFPGQITKKIYPWFIKIIFTPGWFYQDSENRANGKSSPSRSLTPSHVLQVPPKNR